MNSVCPCRWVAVCPSPLDRPQQGVCYQDGGFYSFSFASSLFVSFCLSLFAPRLQLRFTLMFVGTFKVHFESALSKSRITCRPHRNFCHSIHLHPFHHIHVGVVDLVFGLHIDFDFGTVHRRESRSEAQVVSIDTHTYAKRTQPVRL